MPGTFALIESFPQVDGQVRRVRVYKGVLYISGQFTTVGGVPRTNFAAIDPLTGVVLPFTLSSAPNSNVIDFIVRNDVIYIGGFFTAPRNFAAAYDLSGNLLPWNPDLDNAVEQLASDSNVIYIGGNFTTINGGTVRRAIAAVDPVTGIATAWNPDLSLVSQVLAIFPVGGTIYVGGFFTTVNGGTVRNSVAAFDSVTAVATAFDPNIGFGGIAIDFEYYGGNVYIAGAFTTVNGGVPRTHLAAVDPLTGIVNLAFNAQISGGVVNKVKYRAGKLIAVGSFTSAAGRDAFTFAFLDLLTGAAVDPEVNFGTQTGSTPALLDVEVLGTRFFIVGQFERFLGNVHRTNLVGYTFPTGTLLDLSITTDQPIDKVVTKSPGMVFIFGQFTSVTGSNGTFARTGAAAIDSATSEVLPFNPVISGGGDGVLDAMIVGTSVYMVGDFTDVNGSTRNAAAAVDHLTGATTLAWDPDITGLGGRAGALKFDGVNILIGGQFDTVNGATTRRSICMVNATTGVVDPTWDPSVTGISDTVLDIEFDGTWVYIVGQFDTVGGQPRDGVARVSPIGVGAVDLTWIFNANTGDEVLSVALSNTEVYIAGGFEEINGTPQNGFAKIAAGVLDSSWSDGLALNHVVGGGSGEAKIFAVPAPSLVTSMMLFGNFSSSGSTERLSVAQANTLGVLQSFAPNIASYNPAYVASYAVDIAVFFAGTQYISGDFLFIQAHERNNLAVMDSPAPPPTGIPLAPSIEFLNRKTMTDGGPDLTLLKWKPVVKDTENNYVDVTGYRVYRTSSLNLEDPTLIAEITTLDIRGFIDTMFTERINGFYKYCVSAFNSVGEGGKSCIAGVGLAQSDRIG